MKLGDFLDLLRGKITGLNAVSARVDSQQVRLDNVLAITTQLNAGLPHRSWRLK